jgi:hypothetical protein
MSGTLTVLTAGEGHPAADRPDTGPRKAGPRVIKVPVLDAANETFWCDTASYFTLLAVNRPKPRCDANAQLRP